MPEGWNRFKQYHLERHIVVFPTDTLLTKMIFVFFYFLFLLYFTILYWFCHTLTWIHHGCICVPKHEPPSHLPPHRPRFLGYLVSVIILLVSFLWAFNFFSSFSIIFSEGLSILQHLLVPHSYFLLSNIPLCELLKSIHGHLDYFFLVLRIVLLWNRCANFVWT